MGTSFLSAEEFDEQAHRLYESGEYDDALDVLRDGLRHHPDSALLHVGLGYVRIAREEYAWARLSFEEALDLDPEYEDAWVGLGETLLKFGRVDEALKCFSTVDAMGLHDDLELGLTMGRALYREGLFAEARTRFTALAHGHPDSAEVAAARGYTLHALGDDVGARRELRRSLRLDGTLHEARIYLSHLLHDRGDVAGALRELEKVPPAEHWDTLSLWRFVELKCAVDQVRDDDDVFIPWKERIAELEADPDDIDHLLAEVESSFEGAEEEPAQPLELSAQIDFIMRMLTPAGEAREGGIDGHRVRTAEGTVFEGTWEEIVGGMRDHADPTLQVSVFMRRAARQIRERTGRTVPTESPEAFVKAAARLGLLKIEA
ncbi:tetratricopeptide repeat protein [Longimicrobium sp.]|uniref:tetratricopeptide repeat protein n=1 Tax=Longimicrobium sp. TaxID=2029185 RepID=UPI002C819DAC|nr:tetratricopeptide repeat protein [Longimicrobium sp.]HSU13631.1 tetratricopeptide repeat protein [Longimicrobium sp.]